MKREYIGVKDPIGEGLYAMYITDEEIVRCKDCKFTEEEEGFIVCSEQEWTTEPDDFCSRGERKDD